MRRIPSMNSRPDKCKRGRGRGRWPDARKARGQYVVAGALVAAKQKKRDNLFNCSPSALEFTSVSCLVYFCTRKWREKKRVTRGRINLRSALVTRVLASKSICSLPFFLSLFLCRFFGKIALTTYATITQEQSSSNWLGHRIYFK